jgi:LuxR family transcriptional regulator, maltose regulon positive regulatory protein
MLITTKIQLPLQKSNLLSRKHLLDRLTPGKNAQLILITGPAGCGKTSLALQWVNRNHFRTAWYSMDETDNDFDIFFRYLLTALIQIDDLLEEAIGPLLQDQMRLTEKRVIAPLLGAVSGLGEDIYLILDDYHVIDMDEIHHALARILKYLPPKLHVVLISRYRIPKALCRFRFQYDVVEISSEDLKFSDQEAERFFHSVIPLELSRNQIHEVRKFADGWVAGFQIFGFSYQRTMSSQGIEESLKAAGRAAVDYLMNEVVNVQSENVKLFLYQTAALNRFNGEACAFVTGLPDAGKILSDLHRMNLFITPLDPEEKWFRYHPLFSEALREWVNLSFPGLMEEVQKKAALWFAEHQFLEDAFQYAVASHNFEFMADLLEDYLLFLFERYEVASSLRWLAKLPREVFLSRPLLRLFDCAFNINNRQLEEVHSVLPDIESRQEKLILQYQPPKQTLCRDLIVYLKAISEYYQDTFNVDVQKLNRYIRDISPENSPLAGYVKILMAGSRISLGDLKSAETYMRKASGDIFHSESVLAKMTWVHVMAYALRYQGRLNQSEKMLEDAFLFLSRRKLYDAPLKYTLYLPMAWVLYYRHELDKALEYALISLRYAEQIGHVDLILQGYYLIARIYLSRGIKDKAAQYARLLLSLSGTLDHPKLAAHTEALAAALNVGQDEIGFALTWVSRRKLRMDEPFSLYFLVEAMTSAIVSLYRGNLRQAVDLLENLRDRCVKRNLMEIVLEIDILYSGVLWMSGKKDPAKKIMKKALLFAETEGYVQPFVNFSRVILPLMTDMARTTAEYGRSAYFNRLLKACGGRDDNPPLTDLNGQKALPHGLSERELEIVKWMAEGHKNREIADMAFISVNTVKTHAQNLFKKLGVKSRLQAIMRAQQLNLVKKSSRI